MKNEFQELDSERVKKNFG